MARRNIYTLMAVSVVCACVATLSKSFRQSEEAAIRRLFDHASAHISKSGEESALAMAAKCRALAGMARAPVRLSIRGSPLSGEFADDEIAALAGRCRALFDTLDVTFHDLDISLDRGRATVLCAARLSGRTKGGEPVIESRQIDCGLVKVEGRWRVRTCGEAHTQEK